MLFIEEKQRVALPKKYHVRHNHCAVIYDQLTGLLKDRQYESLRKMSVQLSAEEGEALQNLGSGRQNSLAWLADSGRTAELSDFLTRHITLSITHDLVNFVYESLSCAMKGKMTVAFALLRKPFVDELLILEQLLSDGPSFIEKFYHQGDPRGYDPSISKKDALQIMGAACRKLGAKLFYDKDLLHDVRYNKAIGGGLQGITNHALHIVTNDPKYKTSHKNLNFVFSVKEDHLRYWKSYYSIVPLLLNYTVDIVDAIVFPYLQGAKYKDIRKYRSVKRKIALLNWSDYIGKKRKNYGQKIIEVINDNLTCECHECTAPVQLEKADLQLYFHTDLLLCPFCFAQLLTPKNRQIMYKILGTL